MVPWRILCWVSQDLGHYCQSVSFGAEMAQLCVLTEVNCGTHIVVTLLQKEKMLGKKQVEKSQIKNCLLFFCKY